mmetsp:Transcript_18940/g.30794  ORF Transcript_18940/g.30794 Transcript_18940/m.30794 type:complete len:671 (+) Transcript_18940:176-2188(+)
MLSPRSSSAARKLGIEPEDLEEKPLSSFAQPGRSKTIQNYAYELYENRRKMLLQEVARCAATSNSLGKHTTEASASEVLEEEKKIVLKRKEKAEKDIENLLAVEILAARKRAAVERQVEADRRQKEYERKQNAEKKRQAALEKERQMKRRMKAEMEQRELERQQALAFLKEREREDKEKERMERRKIEEAAERLAENQRESERRKRQAEAQRQQELQKRRAKLRETEKREKEQRQQLERTRKEIATKKRKKLEKRQHIAKTHLSRIMQEKRDRIEEAARVREEKVRKFLELKRRKANSASEKFEQAKMKIQKAQEAKKMSMAIRREKILQREREVEIQVKRKEREKEKRLKLKSMREKEKESKIKCSIKALQTMRIEEGQKLIQRKKSSLQKSQSARKKRINSQHNRRLNKLKKKYGEGFKTYVDALIQKRTHPVDLQDRINEYIVKVNRERDERLMLEAEARVNEKLQKVEAKLRRLHLQQSNNRKAEKQEKDQKRKAALLGNRKLLNDKIRIIEENRREMERRSLMAKKRKQDELEKRKIMLELQREQRAFELERQRRAREYEKQLLKDKLQADRRRVGNQEKAKQQLLRFRHKQADKVREQKEKIADTMNMLNMNELEQYSEAKLRLLGVDEETIQVILRAIDLAENLAQKQKQTRSAPASRKNTML